MRRKAWFEIHDHPRCPAFLRDGLTDALETMWDVLDLYGPVVPRLRQALREAGTDRVIDLCSGGGGPWPRLLRRFRRDGDIIPQVRLTDIYPNQAAFERVSGATDGMVQAIYEPVDAQRIPPELVGFRTVFTAFHHFTPAQARAVLEDAVNQRQGIAVFDASRRDVFTMFTVFFVPLLTLVLAPRMRPFRWSRLFWIYCLPVIPFTVWFDGIMSCLRSYSKEDMAELAAGLNTENYRWESGDVRAGYRAITYLIGIPERKASAEMHELATTQTEMPA
jgi:hypothetical protein